MQLNWHLGSAYFGGVCHKPVMLLPNLMALASCCWWCNSPLFAANSFPYLDQHPADFSHVTQGARRLLLIKAHLSSKRELSRIQSSAEACRVLALWHTLLLGEIMAQQGYYPQGNQQFAQPGPSFAPRDTVSKVELSISCSSLKDLDHFSKSDPAVFLYEKRGREWIKVDRTEVIDNDLNPKVYNFAAMRFK